MKLWTFNKFRLSKMLASEKKSAGSASHVDDQIMIDNTEPICDDTEKPFALDITGSNIWHTFDKSTAVKLADIKCEVEADTLITAGFQAFSEKAYLPHKKRIFKRNYAFWKTSNGNIVQSISDKSICKYFLIDKTLFLNFAIESLIGKNSTFHLTPEFYLRHKNDAAFSMTESSDCPYAKVTDTIVESNVDFEELKSIFPNA